MKIGNLEVAFRAATADDESIVVAPWLQGFRFGGDWPRFVNAGRFYEQQKLVIARILARSCTVVACNAARLHQVLGFVCWERGVLHWLFVKRFYGKQGLGSELLRQILGGPPLACSHWTRSMARFEERRRWGFRYDPFILEDDHEATKDHVQRPLRAAGDRPGEDHHERDARAVLHPSGTRVSDQALGRVGLDEGGPDRGAVVAGADGGGI